MEAERSENDRPIFTPLGKGVLDWDAIFPAAKEAGVEWYVYEQDSYEGDLWECVKTSREFLRNFVG
jgi:sugar phosphate isomerase/epimerase